MSSYCCTCVLVSLWNCFQTKPEASIPLKTSYQEKDSESVNPLVTSKDSGTPEDPKIIKTEKNNNKKKNNYRKKKGVFHFYDIKEVILGEGNSSVVKEGADKKTGEVVAIKILHSFQGMENGNEREEAFFREISIMKQIHHPNCLQLFDFFSEDSHYYVVMECLYGNELFTSILEREGGFYKEMDCVPVVFQILSALAYLHALKICHCDIKPENIRFTDKTERTIKLIDFGEATSFAGNPLVDWAGTPNYMAPEIVNHVQYDETVDLWSLGVVVYIMLCGTFPFENDNEEMLFQLIRSMKYKFYSPKWDNVSEDAKDFVSHLLIDRSDRMNVKQALEHRWIVKNYSV